MEGVPNSTGASAHAPPALQEDSAQAPQDAAKKGRFSRKKEKKKAKKAKKASKHSKDRDESEGGGDRHPLNKEPGEAGGLEGVHDSSLHAGHRSAFTPYQRQATGSGANHQGQDSADMSLGNSALPAEGSDGPADSSGQPTQEGSLPASAKPRARSRSASRKKLPSLFRRRDRSQGGEDRRTSDTDLRDGVEDGTDSGRNGGSEEKRSRKTRSLDRLKSRHSAPPVDPQSLRQSASLERDAYRRFDPAKQPRDRLQHMTVKDAVLEYRHRYQPPARQLAAQAGDVRAASDTDLSQPSDGAAPGRQQSATLPRGSTVRETSLLGKQSEVCDEGFPRHNLGQQIKDMCMPIGQRSGIDDVDGPVTSGAHDKDSGIVRNTSTIIFINPGDIQGQGAGTLRGSGDDCQSHQLKPSHHFMQLRKAPLSSSAARRVSQAESSSETEGGQAGQAHKVGSSSSVAACSNGISSLPTTNIPGFGSGLNKVIDSTSGYNATSPEITVNSVQSEGQPVKAGVKMDSSVTMDTSMISSTDSGKRSSDQGFFSEPRESDTDSEVDMSGFSTPPEELYSERDSARNSLSPTVFVNNVSNLLEVPRAKGVYKRSVSDGVGKTDTADSSPPAPAFARTQSFNSNSLLTKAKAKQPSDDVSREGKLPQDRQREAKHSDNGASADKMDQKIVPVMGTSVQQKYRRTFSPVRSKEAEGSREEYAGPVPSMVGVPRDVAQLPQPTPVKPDQPDPDAAITSTDNKERPRLQRGRGSNKKPGYVSSRSFRRKRDVDNKAPDSDVKDAPTVTSAPVEAIDDGVEELQYRIAFQDKSIQTSDSLLNELIKKSKKRKLKPFSSGGKKSKNEQPRAVAEVAADAPPPKYEEEHSRKQGDVTEVTAEDCTTQPVLPLGEGLGRQEDDVPEITPLLQDTEPPAPQGQEPTESTSKKASKPRGTSFRAILALKRKLARNRKKDKQAKDGKVEVEEDKDKDRDREVTADLPCDTFITIENELNLSKLAEIKETDILDDEFIEAAFSPVLHPKKDLRFELIPDEPVQSEEPLPPLSPESRRMTARRNSTRGRERRKKCLHCCKKFIAFLFSHIGLCSLVVGYTIFGGFIFQMLEGEHDREVRADVEQQRRLVMNKIKSLANEYQLDNEKNLNFLMDSLELVLKDYQKKLYTEITDNGWDGNENDPSGQNQSEQWSFASALLYAITVMTTIGYGHVAPKTSYGRVVTIFYAVLGIPLTLLCLTNIGDVMASGFRLLYGKVCCGLCCKLFKPSRRRRRRLPDVEKGLARQVVTTEEGETDKPKEVIQVPTSLCLLLIATYIFAGSLLFSLWEDWDFLTGSYFCFITLSTIGFGDIVPGMDVQSWSKEYKLVLSALYLIFGLSLIAMCFNLVQEDVKAKCRWLGMKIGIIDKPEPPV